MKALPGTDANRLVYKRVLGDLCGKGHQGGGVCAILEHVSKECGNHWNIKVDDGPEFISRTLDAWTYYRKIQLLFSRPGTPTDNAHIESFNGSLREECLYTNWFMSLEDAKEKLERWRNDYSEYRPHSALIYLTPI